VGDPPQGVPLGLAHPLERRGLGITGRRFGEVFEVLERGGDEDEDLMSMVIALLRLGLQIVDPLSERSRPVDLHPQIMTRESYDFQVILYGESCQPTETGAPFGLSTPACFEETARFCDRRFPLGVGRVIPSRIRLRGRPPHRR
jgi:hypothetical protein